jgi:hypothetical protein
MITAITAQIQQTAIHFINGIFFIAAASYKSSAASWVTFITPHA